MLAKFPLGPGRPLDGRVVGFRPAGSKVDLVGIYSQQVCNLLAGSFQQAMGPITQLV